MASIIFQEKNVNLDLELRGFDSSFRLKLSLEIVLTLPTGIINIKGFFFIIAVIVLGLLRVLSPIRKFRKVARCSMRFLSVSFFHTKTVGDAHKPKDFMNLLSSHDVISRHEVALKQWPGRAITSCCSSGLTQHL